MNFSIIIPVYNRPDEVEELLESLTKQTEQNFEVIIIEDGSDIKCDKIIEKYKSVLDISYYFKENGGPATARNFGISKSKFDYFIFFDSDCIIPDKYFEVLKNNFYYDFYDAFGGPDAAHESFSPIQKAINYSMTSFYTTGGIRGGNEKMEQFKPRSFNMGYSRKVFEKTGGFSDMRFGEDVDMSLKIIDHKFKTKLIKEAFVYHKRRTDFLKFFKQVYNSGIARINLFIRHPKSLKLVHLFPSLFLLGTIFIIFLAIINLLFLIPIILYVLLIFTHSAILNKSAKVAFLSIPAAFIQLFGYGSGFLSAVWKRLILSRKEFHAFRNNFYK
ncbi:MAG: glycosyltransferase [Bacteroidales bacterium]|nr:glycosyltransferase [Bacteroidales bacterium]MBN2756856.1 glycosyltransferase [Bacteroidales bacterium]